MRYELNKPYDFIVKDVVINNDILNFMVEVGNSSFPVRGYQEQLENGIPSSISCRIMQDKNKDAYLVQNEVFLYPYIYKSNNRYIFEVVDIKNDFIVLQDKYGLYHAMQKDDYRYSLNEVIVRCVDIIKDNDYKAHLNFRYVKLEDIYPSKKPNVVKNNPTIKSTNLSHVSISEMIQNKDWNALSTYLLENLKGNRIRTIQEEISIAISNSRDSISYWKSIEFFLCFDAHIFLGTLAKIDVSKIPYISDIDDNTLNNIIQYAFDDSDKLKYALELIKPLGHQLRTEYKNRILAKCINLNNSESFYNLFKIVGLGPDEAIVYLLSMQENMCAAYTIYKFYADGKRGKRLNENSSIASFKPSKIAEYTRIMRKSQYKAFKLAGNLIEHTILMPSTLYSDLQKDIAAEGYLAFSKHITRQEQKDVANNILASLTRGDVLKNLTYIKELDYHYLFIDSQTNSYALLVKELAVKEPTKQEKCRATISKVMNYNGKTVFIVSQKRLPTMYAFPPLINQSTILELSFSEGNNGKWYPTVKNYCKLMTVQIEQIPRLMDYKKRWNAEIIRKIDFFTYSVKILNEKK